MSRAIHLDASGAAHRDHAELCALILRRTQELFRLVVVACDGSRRSASRAVDTDIRSLQSMRSVPTIGMAERVGHPLGLSAAQAIGVLSSGEEARLEPRALRAAALDADLADDGPRLSRIARALERRTARPADLAFAQLVHARACIAGADLAGAHAALSFAVELGLSPDDRAAVAQLAEAIHHEAALGSPWIAATDAATDATGNATSGAGRPADDATRVHATPASTGVRARPDPRAVDGPLPAARALMRAAGLQAGDTRDHHAVEQPHAARAVDTAVDTDTATIRRHCWNRCVRAIAPARRRGDPVEDLRNTLEWLVSSFPTDARAIAWGASAIASSALRLRAEHPDDRRILTLIVAAELAIEVVLDAQVAASVRQTVLARRTRVALCEWHTRARLGEIDPRTIDDADADELIRASMLFPPVVHAPHIGPLMGVMGIDQITRIQNSTLDASSSDCWML